MKKKSINLAYESKARFSITDLEAYDMLGYSVRQIIEADNPKPIEENFNLHQGAWILTVPTDMISPDIVHVSLIDEEVKRKIEVLLDRRRARKYQYGRPKQAQNFATKGL